jgi:hypothetical protein
MADLTPDEVRRIAAAVGLVIDDADLDDVTFRINVTLEHLQALGWDEDPA